VTKKVYIGNLPFETTEQQVRDLFAPYGSIDSITMVRDRDTNRFRGFCFVEMKAAADADAAIAGLKGTEVEGRKVRVNEARSRKGKEKKSAPKAQPKKQNNNKNKDSEEARRRALHGRTQRGGFGVAPAHTAEDDDPDALHNRTERGSFGANGERTGGKRRGGGRGGNRRRKNNNPVDPDFPFSGGLRRSS
jgi:RNA recognition motif-containing protein